MSSPVTDLLTGFAEVLAGAGIGLAWQPDGSSYPDGVVPIVKGTERSFLKGSQVVLNWIGLTSEVEFPEGSGYVQVGVTGAPNDADGPNDLSYAIGTALHGLAARQFGQAYLIQCLFQSSVRMPQDSLLRAGVANQFLCDVAWPGTPLRP